MPEIKVQIGGRPFALVCDPGEEASLKLAAEMLDTEARTLQDAIGRVPESRMLLMAGLMLADRTKQVELESRTVAEQVKNLQDRLRLAEENATSLQAKLTTALDKANVPATPAPVPESDLFATDDSAAMDLLAKTAQRLETLAQNLKE